MTVCSMLSYSRVMTALSRLKRAAGRLGRIDGLATFRAMREVRMADWEGRFTSKEQVMSQLHGISRPTEGEERGEPLDYGAMRRERNSQHHAQQHFRGAVAVWECEFEKPYA